MSATTTTEFKKWWQSFVQKQEEHKAHQEYQAKIEAKDYVPPPDCTSVWKTAFGELIWLPDLTATHLTNIKNMLEVQLNSFLSEPSKVEYKAFGSMYEARAKWLLWHIYPEIVRRGL